MIRDLAALSVVVLAFLVMFVPSLADGYFPLVADSFCYSYPLRTTVFNMLRNGEWPLWTHELLSGYPLLSMAQIGVGYPLTWVYLFLPAHWAETVYILAPYLLAPVFTYAYCREVGRTRVAALLAGLGFGYGGFIFSRYTSNGMLANAVVWLPLILIALERSRRGSFLKSLVFASTAYALAVLTGIGQGFVFAGLLALSYALFLSVVQPRKKDEPHAPRSWKAPKRWAPLAVMACAILIAAGVAAFQILETSQASQQSIRRTLSYATFGEGSLTLRTVWRSLLLTFYSYEAIDVAAFMAPLVILLVLPGLIYFTRQAHRDSRVLFWVGAAVVSVVLMLGINTPFYQLVYQVPILNRFRVPARHTLEWSFALAILAAYGWDALMLLVRKTVRTRERETVAIALAMSALLLAFATAVWWSYAVGRPESPYAIHSEHLTESNYLIFKVVQTLLLAAALFLSMRLNGRWRSGLFAVIVMLACLTEPYMLFKSWWQPLHKTAHELSASNPAFATQYLSQFPVEQNRIYTRVNLFHEGKRQLEGINTHNLTMLFGLHNAAGYEPFILERYSRLLGNVGVDSVNPRPGFSRDDNILSADSHVLDLLNTTFVVGYANLSTTLVGGGDKEEIEFPAGDLGVDLRPGELVKVRGVDVTGDTIAIVSSLGHATSVENGTIVARVRVATDQGSQELNLVAGKDTAEWAHERPDVRASIKHSLAPVFDSVPGDDNNTFSANRYWTKLPLGSTRRVEEIEIENTSATASIALWKVVIHDELNRNTTPMTNDHELLSAIQDETRWQRPVSQNGILILRNLRSRSRAWLVTAAEAVDPEEAFRRIRGESDASFDPFQLALVEVAPNQLPVLDAAVPPGEVKQVIYKPNAIEIVTEAQGQSLLVVSATNYPGWIATVDGSPVTLYTTDYVVQGLAVPAGRHIVELRYTAPAARTGAIISVLTLILLGALAIKAHLRSGQ